MTLALFDRKVKIEKDAIRLSWCSEITPEYAEMIKAHDEQFILKFQPLTRTAVPEIWKKGLFTNASKEYVWSYIETLVAKAQLETAEVENENQIAVIGDITGPSDNIDMSDFKDQLPRGPMGDFYRNLPPQLLHKVQQIATKYDNADPADMKNMDFNTMATDMFQSMNPEDMQSISENVASMMSSNPLFAKNMMGRN
jgi:hypothetical protein